jgi:hypothetical protein
LLGLFDSNSDDEDDPDEDVTKPFAYHSPKRESTAKAFSDTTANLSSKPLKEVIRMAKALNVNTDGMLDRQELEEAVECAIAAGGSAKPQPSLGATPRPSESAKPNLVEQMRNIRLQKEEAEAERIKKQRLWQEQENERRAEKDRLKKVRIAYCRRSVRGSLAVVAPLTPSISPPIPPLPTHHSAVGLLRAVQERT